jgi:hypothetical protein
VLEVGVFKGGNVKADQPKLIASHLLAVLESEIPATTAVFSALPPRRLDYRPDQTSKSALALMRHIVLEDEWFLRAIADGKFSPPPDDSDACGLLTPAQAVEYYNATLPAAIARVRQLSDEDLDKTLEPDGRLSAPGDPLPVADGPALGAPPRTVERLHPIDGRQGAGDLRSERRYPDRSGRVSAGVNAFAFTSGCPILIGLTGYGRLTFSQNPVRCMSRSNR